MTVDLLITVGSVAASVLFWVWTQGKRAAERDRRLDRLAELDTRLIELIRSIDAMGDRLTRLEMLLLGDRAS